MKSFDESWEEIHATQEWGKYPSEPVIRFIARNYYKKDRSSVRILDFGCGGGAHTWYLAKEGFDTFAFDGSHSAVEKTKKRLVEDGLKADLRVRDALELDYETEIFDCVLDNAVVYANTSKNIQIMYREIYQLLKPGGKLFSVSFSTGTTGFDSGDRIEKNTFCKIEKGCLSGRGTAHFFDKTEIDAILKQAGFQSVVLDMLRYTDCGCIVEQFLVQAEK